MTPCCISFWKIIYLFYNFNKTCVALCYFTDIPGVFQPSGIEVYYKTPALLKERKLLVCNSSSQKVVFVIDPQAPSLYLGTFVYLFTQNEKKSVLKQQRCATYWWGSLMTQNLYLTRDCWRSLPKAPDLPTTLHLVSHLCSSSLTILELPEVCQTWSSVTKFQLVGYIKQFLWSKVSWRCALYIEEKAR